MRKKIIMDENRWLLEAITEEYETISAHTGKIPKIEIDILMENLRKFYENLRILQRLEDPHLTEEQHARPMPAPLAPTSAAVAPPPPPPPATPAPEPTPEPPRPAPLNRPPEVQPRKQESTPQAKRAARMQEIDLFAQEEPPLNVKLRDARDRAFSPKIPPRIENLKMAIPINDKFMFINDLFDGNLREYNETIEALNGFKTLDQAAEYLDLMKRKNLWDTSSSAFLKLKELVERHY